MPALQMHLCLATQGQTCGTVTCKVHVLKFDCHFNISGLTFAMAQYRWRLQGSISSASGLKAESFNSVKQTRSWEAKSRSTVQTADQFGFQHNTEIRYNVKAYDSRVTLLT
jgi:hypothetical protein